MSSPQLAVSCLPLGGGLLLDLGHGGLLLDRLLRRRLSGLLPGHLPLRLRGLAGGLGLGHGLLLPGRHLRLRDPDMLQQGVELPGLAEGVHLLQRLLDGEELLAGLIIPLLGEGLEVRHALLRLLEDGHGEPADDPEGPVEGGLVDLEALRSGAVRQLPDEVGRDAALAHRERLVGVGAADEDAGLRVDRRLLADGALAHGVRSCL